MSNLCASATAVILVRGPTKIGTISPADAAWVTPRSEVSSQGCTTTVFAAEIPFALAIRRSYFDTGGWSVGPSALIAPISLSRADTMTTLRVGQCRSVSPHYGLIL